MRANTSTCAAIALIVLVGACRDEPPRRYVPLDRAGDFEQTGDANGDPATGDPGTAGDPVATGDHGATGDPGVALECPLADDYIGEVSWPGRFEPSTDVCFLGDATESAPLERSLAERAVVLFPPGSYPLPTEEGAFEMRLPACVQLAEHDIPLLLGEPGSLAVSRWENIAYASLRQPMLEPSGREWTLSIWMESEDGPYELTGGALFDDEGRWINLIPSSSSVAYVHRMHHLTFNRGELHSELIAMWGGTPSSGILFHASGELDGIPFEQDSYWKLTNNYYHHFFGADWAVLLDAPIGSACGIQVLNADPIGLTWTEWPLPDVSTIHCDLSVDESLEAVEASAEELGPTTLTCPGLPP